MTAETTTTPLGRAFALLHLLADKSGTGARVPEICAHLGTHRVSAHRLIKTLSELGYVSQAADLSYHLGFEAWALGLNSSARFVPEPVLRAMKRVCARTEECVLLMRRSGTEGICIADEEGIYPVRSLVTRVGTRWALGIGAASIAILAQLPPAEARDIIRSNADAYAPHGLTAASVETMVKTARRLGYAFSEGPVVAESRTLAVPLPSLPSGAAQMSMSIATFESRLRDSRRAELIGILREEAANLA
jgi:DNA-binding IclR family transcriptional regulator